MKKRMIPMLILVLVLMTSGCTEKEKNEVGVQSAAAETEVENKTEIKEEEKAQAPYESSSNDFLKNASPETSALALYYYDGEAVHREFLFGTQEVKKAVKELSDVGIKEALDWIPEKITTPVYGVDIGGKDGDTIFGVWSNGYWITADGTAYVYEYDFEKLVKNYEWESPNSFSSLTVLPCARHLMLREGKWYPKMMTPAKEKDAPAGILLTITDQTSDMLTAEIANNSGDEWFFGEYFSLEVKVEDTWYQVPTTPGNWAFTDIGLILASKESMEMEYYLKMYGDLPAGTYRLVVEELTAEFEI